MSQDTKIEWCDSVLNLQMGCDGCELWTRGRKTCYAGVLTGRYGHRKGWPKSFGEPVLFPERLTEALKWSDLTGKDRPKKPWLNGRPRMIFLDDMGDTFTESLPLDWLAPHLTRMAASPHHYMLLTKRGSRMRQFSERYPLPKNVWPGVSVTSRKTLRRLNDLVKVEGGGPKWVSAEPLWEWIDLDPWLSRLGLVIIGGESGPGANPCDVAWIRSIVSQCKAAGVACFVKQLGRPYDSNPAQSVGLVGTMTPVSWRLKHSKGGDPDEWPTDLCVRQFPEVARA